ncbi:MAG TPA: META domain-containing protein [Pyrinomonadaceae bacterium]|nr:META domain-containing protein [Pyrinomonadaceae bacterium]HMP66504.1 META domain-containing protein [Pyrinomonadaceae bacterium]
MTKTMTRFLVAFTFASLVAVTATAQTSGVAGYKWALVEMNGEAAGPTRAYVEFTEDRRNVSGNAGCNRMFGGVRIARSTMRFSGIGTTRMFCDGLMEAESEFLDTLKSVSRFRQRGDNLTLLAGNRAVLKFAGTSIETDDTSVVGITLESRKWLLESIKGQPIGSAQYQAFIVFRGPDEGAGGNTSCNVFGGNYSASKGVFKLSMPIQTLRACIEDESMSIERGMLDGLQQANRFEIFEDKLTLYEDNVAVLVFRGSDLD